MDTAIIKSMEENIMTQKKINQFFNLRKISGSNIRALITVLYGSEEAMAVKDIFVKLDGDFKKSTINSLVRFYSKNTNLKYSAKKSYLEIVGEKPQKFALMTEIRNQIDGVEELDVEEIEDVKQAIKQVIESENKKNGLKTCEICGKEFKGKWNSKYCSKTCSKKAKNNK